MADATIEAVLWDLDGTLVDSEPLHRRAILDTLDSLGVDASSLAPHEFVGRGERDFWEYAKEKFGLDPELDVLIDRKDARYSVLAGTELRLMRGAVGCLDRMEARSLRMAVASGSTPRAIAASVTATNLGRYFRHLVSSLDPECARSKPAPDVFLLAARRLDVAPERCLVIEDAEWGVKAARAAGMRVVVVPNDWTRGHDLTGAESVVDSLDELDPDGLLRRP